MSHPTLGLTETISCMEQLQLVYKQEKFFQRFGKFRGTVTEFLDCLSDLREAYVNGERNISIDPDQFRNLVISCEDGFLLNVPEELREPLRLEAEQSALNTESLPRAGTIHMIAVVELRVRTLILLVLRLLSAQYLGEARHRDWDEAIAEAGREVEASRRAWRGVG